MAQDVDAASSHRRLKLGRLLDTLPERLALARTEHLPHHDFLEMLLTDEVTAATASQPCCAPRPRTWSQACIWMRGTSRRR
ncbi:MAG TPA: hypothetical protein VFW65_05470 [Pseudonocardiaceae bacterium]|nr:hypothetical protein [Pseudonocardiaceae bacterium]